MQGYILTLEMATAMKAARVGGAVVLDYFCRLASGDAEAVEKVSKGGSEGLVTRADVEAESAIVQEIKDVFPSHAFLGEETFNASVTSEHLWVIDPLDGTNNFAQGIPHFAISIAYYREGKPECGVVFSPFYDDMYWAQAGQGAWRGAQQVKVSEHQQLTDALVAVGFYYDRGQMMRDTLASVEKLFDANVLGIRRMGTAALDLIQVGLGRFGGYFEYTLSPWDFAAGRLFVEEAGGQVTDCEGGDLKLQKTSVLASNQLLHKALLERISRESRA